MDKDNGRDEDDKVDKIKTNLKENTEEKHLLPQKQVQIIDPVKAVNLIGQCHSEEPEDQKIALKTYNRRWVVLAVVALLNNINTMVWIAFSPISNHVDTYYGKDSTIYFSAVYIFITIPVGIIAMLAEGYFGLRWSILTAAWANGLGTLIRLSSSFIPDSLSGIRFPIGILGQGIAALAYPFIMFLPTKVAAAWFPDYQRTLATTIGVMSNPLGVLIANLISPLIVETCEQVRILNIIFAVPSVILTIVASLAITRSAPKIPPTISAGQHNYPFFQGVKECFTSKQYIVLLVVMGGGIGMFNTLYTLMQQLLCPSGYTNLFSGMTSAILITGGVIGATAASFVVDRTKLYEEVLKVSMAIAVVFGLLFLQLILHREFEVFILMACFVFGVFGLAAYPVGLQLSAECTYPVSETTSTGFVVLSGQIQTIIYLAVMKAASKPLQNDYKEYEVCTLKKVIAYEHLDYPAPTCGHGNVTATMNGEETVQALDFTMAVIFMSIIATMIALLLILLFRPELRRMAVEQGVLLTQLNKKEEENTDDRAIDLTRVETLEVNVERNGPAVGETSTKEG